MRLIHASLEWRDDAYYVVAVPGGEIAVNGTPTALARLSPGDRIAVGPFDIAVLEPPAGHNLALTVELARPMGDAYGAILSRSRTELTRVGLSKRGWCWLLLVAVAIVFLGLPLLAALGPSGAPDARPGAALPAPSTPAQAARRWLARADHLWLSGEISSAHRFFAGDCHVCHRRPFVQVEDEACLTCHETIEQHADPKRFHAVAFEGTACQACHKEHNGAGPILIPDQALCVACHARPGDWQAASEVGPVSDFATGHPEFRATVVVAAAGPVLARQRLAGEAPPHEESGLHFTHAKHLEPKGIKHPTKGVVRLACADCHRPEPGGLGMLPITMETQCRSCHLLLFDPDAPGREVPHGKPREVVEMLRDFYANEALRQRLEAGPAEAGARRLPRSQAGLSREEAAAALDWARRRARDVARETIGKRTCKTCHEVTPPANDDEPWGIAPVKLAQRWLPHASFPHDKHTQTPCGDCHKAAQSTKAQDVLLPGIAVCRRCHGGEAATEKVPSTCIDCHDFHRHGLPPLRSAHAP